MRMNTSLLCHTPPAALNQSYNYDLLILASPAALHRQILSSSLVYLFASRLVKQLGCRVGTRVPSLEDLSDTYQ